MQHHDPGRAQARGTAGARNPPDDLRRFRGRRRQKADADHGRIDNIQPGKSFDVVYFGFGSKDFTDRYVLKGDTYVLAAGGKSRMQTC